MCRCVSMHYCLRWGTSFSPWPYTKFNPMGSRCDIPWIFKTDSIFSWGGGKTMTIMKCVWGWLMFFLISALDGIFWGWFRSDLKGKKPQKKTETKSRFPVGMKKWSHIFKAMWKTCLFTHNCFPFVYCTQNSTCWILEKLGGNRNNSKEKCFAWRYKFSTAAVYIFAYDLVSWLNKRPAVCCLICVGHSICSGLINQTNTGCNLG